MELKVTPCPHLIFTWVLEGNPLHGVESIIDTAMDGITTHLNPLHGVERAWPKL